MIRSRSEVTRPTDTCLAIFNEAHWPTGERFYGSAGRMMLSKRGKLEVYGQRNERIENSRPKMPPPSPGSHHAELLDAIRQGRRPNADVAIGHDSVALVHLANAAIRADRSLTLDPAEERILDDDSANALLSRTYRDGGHWAIPRGETT